jgi:DNA invertase Pin-like site-specific DNA recombinase
MITPNDDIVPPLLSQTGFREIIERPIVTPAFACSHLGHLCGRGIDPSRRSVEFVDQGVSGTKDRRPALDALLKDAKRRRFDVLVIWKLDRLGRSLRHLVLLMEELQNLGIALVSLGEGLDLSTPAGRLQAGLLAAVAQFERERIRERVLAGLQRARGQGRRLGRPKAAVPLERLVTVNHLGVAAAADALGVSRSTLKRWRRVQKSLSPAA